MTRVGPGTFELGATALSRYQKVCLATAGVMMAVWFIALGIPTSMTSVAHAAQVNSYSTFGTVSYDAGSCGVDSTAGVVSSPGVKKILKVSNTEIYVVGCFTNLPVLQKLTMSQNGMEHRGLRLVQMVISTRLFTM